MPRADGRTSFQALQNALGAGAGARRLYFVFDLLYLDGEDLTGAAARGAQAARWRSCCAAARRPRPGPLRYSDHVVGQGRAFFEQAQARGLEGIVSKRRGEPYRRGRSPGWLKIKCISRQEFVIGGFTDPEGSRSGIGALLVGHLRRRRQAGLRRQGGHRLHPEAAARAAPQAGAAGAEGSAPSRWPRRRAGWGARPTGCGPSWWREVAFIEWTDDGRLRHPSFQGLREDKKPQRWCGSGPPRPAPSPPSQAPRPSQQPSRSSQARAEQAQGDARTSAPVVLGERISNPDRVVYPELSLTKLDVARYYEAVGEAMLPHVKGRPLSLVRCPEGLAGDCFYMKHYPMGAARGAGARSRSRRRPRPASTWWSTDAQGLVALAQMGVLEVHTWNSTRDHLEHPDRFVLDLDPGPRGEVGRGGGDGAADPRAAAGRWASSRS